MNLSVIIVFLTAFVQGMALIIVPSLGALLTDPLVYGFSEGAYGWLFSGQVITALAAALYAPVIIRRQGWRPALRWGLLCNAVSMAAMGAGALAPAHPAAAYGCFFMGTAALGAGFGITLPVINLYGQRLFPRNSAAALTGLHAALGTGTLVVPLLISALIPGGLSAGVPLAAAAIFGGLLIAGQGIPRTLEHPPTTSPHHAGTAVPVPSGVWLFLVLMFLYGHCETMFANWSIIFLTRERGLAPAAGGQALTIFWTAITAGRVITSLAANRIPARMIFRFLPCVIGLALWAVVQTRSAAGGIAAYGLAGLGCSAMFPLIFSFVQQRFAAVAETVSGRVLAAYLLGYGAATYGGGWLMSHTALDLGGLYLASLLPAAAVVVLANKLMADNVV